MRGILLSNIILLLMAWSLSSRAGQTLSGNKIDPRASLTITNKNVMNAFNNQYNGVYSLGYLLGKVGERYQYNTNFGRNNYTIGEYMVRIFNEGYQDQLDYENYMMNNPGATSMGGFINNDRKFSHLMNLWDEKLGSIDLDDVTNPNQLKNGPFKMLAIVNRMDLAQDRDPRNNNEITFESRALGELHILYGLKDTSSKYEGGGKPYPMVLVMSYRIPVLNKNSKGNYFPQSEATDTEDGFKYTEGPLRNISNLEDESEWRKKMKLWAERFASLSDHRNSSGQVMYNQAYKDKLKSILDDIVVPENFLSLKTNTKINKNEHELREWYTIASTNTRWLIHRKLRREPFRCLQESPELAALIDYYWIGKNDSTAPEYMRNDLDMFTRDFDLGNAARVQEFKAGYEILRDNERTFLSDLVVGSPTNDTLRWASGTCGNKQLKMPYEMRPQQGSDDNQEKILMLPRFARVYKKGEVWQLPHVSGNSALKERKRHAFAMRTCTGCHSQEGATRGFHIYNRMDDNEATLSPYLIGTSSFLNSRREPSIPSDIDNTFTHGGKTYTYDTLKAREELLHKALRKEQRIFENLLRPEMH